VSALLVGHCCYRDHSVSALVTSRLSIVWPSAVDPPLMTGPSPRQPRSPSNSSDASRPRTLRTLPIRVSPRTGEALDSYLEALAERSGTPWGDFLDAVGLGRPRGRPSTYPWLIELSQAHADSVGIACGIDMSALSAMTLNALLGSQRWAGDIGAPATLSPARSRFCPSCLGSGQRWQLWWRLRWAFACPTHQCLLADVCGDCSRWQRIGPLPMEVVPDTVRCARIAEGASGRAARRCGAELSASKVYQLGSDHPALLAQNQVLDVLHHGSAFTGIYARSPVSGREYLADLSALCGRIQLYAESRDLETYAPADLLREGLDLVASERRVGIHEPTPSQAAVTAVIAVGILASADSEEAGRRLRWLVASCRRRGFAVRASTLGWSRHASATLVSAQLSALAPFLNPSDQLRHRSASGRPRPPSMCRRQRVIPSTFWRGCRDYFLTRPIGVEQLGTALSVALCVVGDRRTLAEVAEDLGSTTRRSVSRVLQALHADSRWPEMLRALTELADELDDGLCPIDYQRRRALPFEEFLPREGWDEVCRGTDLAPGRSMRIRLVRCWMFERISGTPARQCGSAWNHPEFRTKLSPLPRLLPPLVVSRLDESATA
jgi:TniQ